MAIGIRTAQALGHHNLDAQLLTDVVATTNGEWIGLDGFYPCTIHISGITTATVQVRVSNSPTRPADAVHEAQAGFDIVADQLVTIDYPVRWVKCRISAWTAGTINGWLYGRD